MNADDPTWAVGASDPDLDGHSIEELSAYLDHGRQPFNASIEGSASCALALAAMERLSAVTATLLADTAEPPPGRLDQWMSGILARISLDAHAGRDLPLAPPAGDDVLLVTEGALRSLVRAAGDRLAGALVGRVTIQGDLGSSTAGSSTADSSTAEVALRVEMDVLVGIAIPAVVAELRREIDAAVRRHTTFSVPTIDVVVRDLHLIDGGRSRSGPEDRVGPDTDAR